MYYFFQYLDKDDNIYATNHDQVYKCLAGETNFIKMTGITDVLFFFNIRGRIAALVRFNKKLNER